MGVEARAYFGVLTLCHHFADGVKAVLVNQQALVGLVLGELAKRRADSSKCRDVHTITPGRSVRGERANFTRLVLGFIEAKFCK